MTIIDGKKISAEIKLELKEAVDKIVAAGKRPPHLAAILVGNNGASEAYVGHKVKACAASGFESSLLRFPETITEAELLEEVNKLNQNDGLDGYIVQLPLPAHINPDKIIQAIKPEKDVDGFHPVNVGRMCIGHPSYVSATPAGIMELLKRYKIETEGKNCVVVGRSNIVGRPMSILMSNAPVNCTVTVCHSRTKNLNEICANADILIAALGKAEFVKANMVKEGAVVIDVGITRVEDNNSSTGFRLKGDVAYDEVAPKCSFITPVPGGVGPMTVYSLMMNTLKAYNKEIYG